MAGDWIKMRMDLSRDPAVLAIACALDVEEDLVVGKLHRLWSWASEQTTDGNAPGVTKKWVDRFVGRDGFAQAMIDAGWLAENDGGLSFPHFDRHMSDSAKTRALTAKRKSKCSAKKRWDGRSGNAGGNAVSVTEVTPEALLREEKRREEVNPPKPPFEKSAGTPEENAGWLSREFCNLFRGKRRGGASGACEEQAVRETFDELLRRGNSYQALLAEIKRKDRARDEPIWEFAKRYRAGQPATAPAVSQQERDARLLEQRRRVADNLKGERFTGSLVEMAKEV